MVLVAPMTTMMLPLVVVVLLVELAVSCEPLVQPPPKDRWTASAAATNCKKSVDTLALPAARPAPEKPP